MDVSSHGVHHLEAERWVCRLEGSWERRIIPCRPIPEMSWRVQRTRLKRRGEMSSINRQFSKGGGTDTRQRLTRVLEEEGKRESLERD